MGYLDLDTESERVKTTAEEILANGGHFQPMIGIFEEGSFKGAIVLRDTDMEDENDKASAFAEACTLIQALHGDEVVVSFYGPIDRIHSETKEQQHLEAINVMVATDNGADAKFVAFEVDGEGLFKGWLEDVEETNDLAAHRLSKNMIPTLAHFMSKHIHIKYAKALMRTLSKAGHMITLPEGQFILDDESGTMDSSHEMKQAIREG